MFPPHRKASIAFIVATLLVCTPAFGVELTLQADTILLNNGGDDIAVGASSDQEDNFGGRVEVIGGINSGNPRDMLFRYDPTPVAEQIMDPNQVVSEASMLLIQREGRDQPSGGDTTFEVYPLVSENSGWFEGTDIGSRAGWSGDLGFVSRSWKVTGENEEGDGAELWFSEQQFNIGDGFAYNPEADSDTGDLIGLGFFNPQDRFYGISLDAEAVEELLPLWLADPEGNPGFIITSPDATGQWFFESKEGDAGAILDVQFTTVVAGPDCDFDQSGDCDVIDLDALLYDGLVNKGQEFDLDGNGTVDAADRDRWLMLAGTKSTGAPYQLGDADLDGTVDATDLNVLGLHWQVTNATSWEQGDFDGDGNVNATDLNAVGVNWLKRAPEEATAVPEPSVATLLAIICIASLGVGNRRHKTSVFKGA